MITEMLDSQSFEGVQAAEACLSRLCKARENVVRALDCAQPQQAGDGFSPIGAGLLECRPCTLKGEDDCRLCKSLGE